MLLRIPTRISPNLANSPKNWLHDPMVGVLPVWVLGEPNGCGPKRFVHRDVARDYRRFFVKSIEHMDLYNISRWWLGFKYFFYLHPYLGKISNLTNIFEMG